VWLLFGVDLGPSGSALWLRPAALWAFGIGARGLRG